MLPFFRKIRWRLAANNQFFKYSRYAIGEIILVVIGILIALYINNWNEQRKEREKFDQLLVEVENELIINIKHCRSVLNNYLFRQDSIANIVLYNDLTYDDYRRNPSLGSLVEGGRHPAIITDAYDKLLEINGLLSPIQDSIRTILTQFYQVRGEIYDTGERVILISRQNRKENKKFSWYNDWIKQIPNEDRISYLVDNPSYKKNVAEYIHEQMDWLRPDIEEFEIDGRKIYNSIFDYLQLNMIKHNDSLYFQYAVEDYKHYIGTYIETERSSPTMIIVDSTIISQENDKLYYTNYFYDTNNRREIIPVSKYNFRTETGSGFYRLIFDDQGKVIEHLFSSGVVERKFKKIP